MIEEFDKWLEEQVTNLQRFQLETFPQLIIKIE